MRSRMGAGEGIWHPLYAAALGLLVVNDYCLKGRAPFMLTGKLSDVTGLVILPLLLQAIYELGLHSLGRYRQPSNHLLVLMSALSGAGFISVQLSAVANTYYAQTLGMLRRSLSCAWANLDHGLCPAVVEVQSWSDPSDLWALPALVMSLAVGWAPSGTACRTRALPTADEN